MSNYGQHYNTRKTPQSEQIPGKAQVRNNAGGFAFEVTPWTRLDRFLILGTEGGTYYQTEKALTRENAKFLEGLIREHGPQVVDRIVEISDAGRAPKNDPAIFALAMCLKLGDDATRAAARNAVSKVCRIGTHLFHFARDIEAFGGWGRGTRKAISSWYTQMPLNKLATQAVKYQSRDGWSHRDLLRLSHPKTGQASRDALFSYMVNGQVKVVDAGTAIEDPSFNDLRIIDGFEAAKRATTAKEIIGLIREYNLPRECIPTQFLTEPSVWEALLPHMGITALVRNLATMTRVGLIAPMNSSDGLRMVKAKLGDAEEIKKSRVHPIQMLSALLTYKSGHGFRGTNTWTPVQQVVDALDAGFYTAFGNVTPTGKNMLLALDVSGSMDAGLVGNVPGLTPRVAAAAMAMVIARTEPNYHIVGFSSGAPGEFFHGDGRSQWSGYRSGIVEIPISPKMRLDTVHDIVDRIPMGGTDCALPMLYAKSKKMDVDAFAVFTDNETWAGSVHPTQALKDYRAARNAGAKLAVFGMTATDFTIADPNDAGMMDFVGFDSGAVQVFTDFVSDGGSRENVDDGEM